jgi:hypothetical protein
MKTITLNLVKGLLVIVLFTGVSVALSTTGVQAVSEARAGGNTGAGAGGTTQGGVTTSTVNQYLVAHAYSNIQSLSVYSSSNSGTAWRAVAYSNASGAQVSVYVYVQGSQIIGGTESPL